MRAHNVLCNSYNSRDKPLQLSSCTFCVVVHISEELVTSSKRKLVRALRNTGT
jgi:hypothetical protein